MLCNWCGREGDGGGEDALGRSQGNAILLEATFSLAWSLPRWAAPHAAAARADHVVSGAHSHPARADLSQAVGSERRRTDVHPCDGVDCHARSHTCSSSALPTGPLRTAPAGRPTTNPPPPLGAGS